MMRSMNSAVSSLKNHQTRMDVIGNNIANVNTVSYKSARTTFKDTYSQMTRTPSGNSGDRGGINPSQIGLGMNISSIDNAMDKGTIDTTGISTDLYIDGEGFFQVEGPEGTFYTRDGNMNLDEEGYLVKKNGLYLQGYQSDNDGNIVEKLGKIQVPLKDVIKPKLTTTLTLEGNLNSKAGTGVTPPAQGVANVYNRVPATGDPATYVLKDEFADNSTAKRTSILGKRISTDVIDSLGGKHAITIDFVKSATPNQWDVYAFRIDPATGSMIEHTINPAQIAFTGNGVIDPNDPAAVKQLTLTGFPTANGSNPIGDVTVKLANLTQFERESTTFVKTNDGYPTGELNKMTIGSDGKVIGSFSNGSIKVLGQVVTSTFANVYGLKKEGDNLWSPTENSGEANINKPGSGGNGPLVSGALEMSNVDLAKEFTNMIVTQRGFQANSRVITTTDQMLEELVNLKR